MNFDKTIKLTSWLIIAAAGIFIHCCPALADEAPSDVMTLEVKQFLVEGENPVSASETEELLRPYLGNHSSLDSLEAAPVALESALRKRGYVFHRVIIPAQRPENGIIKLQVVRYTLNAVEVTGNKYFSAENILRSLPGLETGKSPDVSELAGELATANGHPAKRLTLVIKESHEPDALDAEIKVRDVPARQSFVSLTGHSRDDNPSIDHGTGYTRLTFGHQESNLFDRDHVLTMTYTTSPDHLNDVSQYGLFYWIPLYGYNSSLSAYATYSDVSVGSIGTGSQSFDVSGRGEFFGIRFDHTFRKVGETNHGISIALDDRYFKSNESFQGTSLPSTAVSSRPLSLRYFVDTERAWGNVSGYAEGVFNLGGGSSSSDSAYAIARVGADSSWKAIRYGADANYTFPSGWSLMGKLRGQFSDEPLIPGEQFGLGGDNSVRGLRDREISGDLGYSVNFEVHAPSFKNGLTPLAFFDQGMRKNVKTVAGIPNADGAASLGLGLRWKMQNRLEVSADFAHVINGVEGGTPEGHNKLHFSAFWRF